jgi:hypothetical protein
MAVTAVIRLKAEPDDRLEAGTAISAQIFFKEDRGNTRLTTDNKNNRYE